MLSEVNEMYITKLINHYFIVELMVSSNFTGVSSVRTEGLHTLMFLIETIVLCQIHVPKYQNGKDFYRICFSIE